MEVLSQRLPREVAQHIVEIGACVHIQAMARGMLARARRAPRVGKGFCNTGVSGERASAWASASVSEWVSESVSEWASQSASKWVYLGSTEIVDALIEWARSWRPGVYEVKLKCSHPDGLVSKLGSERIIVTPSGTHANLRDWRMYLQAFQMCHGTAEYDLTLRQL